MDALAAPNNIGPAPMAARLPCPDCDEPVRVSARQLVSGTQVQCVHCGCEAEVTREYDLAHGQHRWILVDPLDDIQELDEEAGPGG